MKYWPLTAVLLAFWLGRETGADEKAAPKIARFDETVCGRVKLVGRGDGRPITVIGPGMISISSGSELATLSPGYIDVSSGVGGKQPQFSAPLSVSERSANVAATAATSGYECSLFASQKNAIVSAENRKVTKAKGYLSYPQSFSLPQRIVARTPRT